MNRGAPCSVGLPTCAVVFGGITAQLGRATQRRRAERPLERRPSSAATNKKAQPHFKFGCGKMGAARGALCPAGRAALLRYAWNCAIFSTT